MQTTETSQLYVIALTQQDSDETLILTPHADLLKFVTIPVDGLMGDQFATQQLIFGAKIGTKTDLDAAIEVYNNLQKALADDPTLVNALTGQVPYFFDNLEVAQATAAELIALQSGYHNGLLTDLQDSVNPSALTVVNIYDMYDSIKDDSKTLDDLIVSTTEPASETPD